MPNPLPSAIVNDLIKLSLRDREIAYLEIDLQGMLLQCDGELLIFGLDHLKTGQPAESQWGLLTGLLDAEALPLYLPFVQTSHSVTADIHVFKRDERIWVLMMSTEEKRRYHQAFQQNVYDLRLQHTRQTSILNQHLGREIVERLEDSLQDIEQNGERRELTILFADLRNFTRYSENHAPETVFETLNTYLSRMIPMVLHNQGVLDKIIGDEIMAIFGLNEDKEQAAQNALITAQQILLEIELLNRQRRQQGQIQMQVGIGIATGPVSLGVLGSQNRKSLTVIGNHVNLAARLQSQAQGQQMFIDENTYRLTPMLALPFQTRRVSLKGYSSDLRVHAMHLNEMPNLKQRLAEWDEDPTLY